MKAVKLTIEVPPHIIAIARQARGPVRMSVRAMARAAFISRVVEYQENGQMTFGPGRERK